MTNNIRHKNSNSINDDLNDTRIYPYWLKSALNASEHGRISDLKYLTDESNNGGKWDFLKSPHTVKGSQYIFCL